MTVEAFCGCRQLLRRQKGIGAFTVFERTILASAVTLSSVIIIGGLWFFATQWMGTNPWIADMQPILISPFLSLHVSIVSVAYLLLLLTFIVALPRLVGGRYLVLSRPILYPAMDCLAIGIFVGAIWANLSWGEYWSWDPKESWALISLMVYAVALHDGSMQWLRKPRAYHLFIALSFLVLLMTCFGVNMLLSSLHSYA